MDTKKLKLLDTFDMFDNFKMVIIQQICSGPESDSKLKETTSDCTELDRFLFMFL